MRTRKKKKVAHQEEEEWLLPYSDMLTLLLALFIVMFAMAKVDDAKFQEVSSKFNILLSSTHPAGNTGILPGHPNPDTKLESDTSIDKTEEKKASQTVDSQSLDTKKISDAAHQIEDDLTDSGYGDSVAISIENEGVRIVLQSGILFEQGSADILPDITPQLIPLAKTLGKLDNQVIIAGYTDDVPINNQQFHSNWELSSARAMTIMNFLIQQNGLKENAVSIQAYGEFSPKVPNDNEEARAQNRRVELFIIRNDYNANIHQ